MPKSRGTKYPDKIDDKTSMPTKFKGETVAPVDMNTAQDAIIAIEMVLGPNGDLMWKKSDPFTIPADSVEGYHIKSNTMESRHYKFGSILESHLANFNESKIIFSDDGVGAQPGHTHTGNVNDGKTLDLDNIHVNDVIPDYSGTKKVGSTNYPFKFGIFTSGLYFHTAESGWVFMYPDAVSGNVKIAYVNDTFLP